jgi:hypothetical protein
MLDRTAERVDTWLENHNRLYLALCAALCFITFSGYSHVKAPWVDEILQLTVARQDGFHGIWSAEMHGIIAEPPFLSLMQHYLMRVFGDGMFPMRLPAIAGFTLGCLSLACLARRYVPAIFAASVFFMPYATTIRWRAMDARSYGMMFGWTALTLLCWDRMDREGARRNAWRVAFALSLAALMSTHFYSILVLLPLGLGEITRWIQKRRVEWATVVCVAAGCIPYIIWLPILVSASREYMAGLYSRVAFESLYTFYDSAVSTLPFVGAFILILAAMALRRSPVGAVASEPSGLGAPASVCIGFLLVPVVGFLAGLLVTGVFIPYHYMIAAVGFALGVPLALAAICGNNRTIGLALFLAIAGHGLFVTARGLSGYVRRETPYPTLAEVRKLIPEQRPDIVIPSPFEFLPFQEATRADPQNNLMYLYDAAKSRQILKVDTPELNALHLRGISTARFEPFDKYVATHDRFYTAVTDDSMGVWLNTYLSRNMAARFTWLGAVGRFELYRVELPNGSRLR